MLKYYAPRVFIICEVSWILKNGTCIRDLSIVHIRFTRRLFTLCQPDSLEVQSKNLHTPLMTLSDNPVLDDFTPAEAASYSPDNSLICHQRPFALKPICDLDCSTSIMRLNPS